LHNVLLLCFVLAVGGRVSEHGVDWSRVRSELWFEFWLAIEQANAMVQNTTEVVEAGKCHAPLPWLPFGAGVT
jgi:hypothetical protein